jgi:hypothetical protein
VPLALKMAWTTKTVVQAFFVAEFELGSHICDRHFPNFVRKFTKKHMKTIGLRDI